MTPTQIQAVEEAISMVTYLWHKYDLSITDHESCNQTIKALRAAMAEQADDKAVNMAPLSEEPNWRHPKIQGLIGSEARLRIQVNLIWRILEDPNQEFGPSDMEYWDTLDDKLKSTLAAHGSKVTDMTADNTANEPPP